MKTQNNYAIEKPCHFYSSSKNINSTIHKNVFKISSLHKFRHHNQSINSKIIQPFHQRNFTNEEGNVNEVNLLKGTNKNNNFLKNSSNLKNLKNFNNFKNFNCSNNSKKIYASEFSGYNVFFTEKKTAIEENKLNLQEKKFIQLNKCVGTEGTERTERIEGVVDSVETSKMNNVNNIDKDFIKAEEEITLNENQKKNQGLDELNSNKMFDKVRSSHHKSICKSGSIIPSTVFKIHVDMKVQNKNKNLEESPFPKGTLVISSIFENKIKLKRKNSNGTQNIGTNLFNSSELQLNQNQNEFLQSKTKLKLNKLNKRKISNLFNIKRLQLSTSNSTKNVRQFFIDDNINNINNFNNFNNNNNNKINNEEKEGKNYRNALDMKFHNISVKQMVNKGTLLQIQIPNYSKISSKKISYTKKSISNSQQNFILPYPEELLIKKKAQKNEEIEEIHNKEMIDLVHKLILSLFF